ncbi:hypothetical protein RIF23_14420 [Lipingzhangella sp. LS1_29]|uniref:DUF5642 domain-containing protein n=1 Tax=Lipingzhangella rawalii TaxID=2055835 RepID=A0ABU2H9H8_9ACTN|nr:hypothetical protein [Lipingzhangella rawalii]MDS1271490.1 hypothetical protein [Lipingzhangella rawalii]
MFSGTHVAVVVAGAALLAGATGCGESGGADGGGSYTTDELHDALLPEFEDASRVADQDETGRYAELSAVQQVDELRQDTELDKPECLDATEQWTQLDEVRNAPSALASYGREGEAITHALVDVDSATADEVIAIRPPEECSSYEATDPDGATTTYELDEIDVAELEDSFALEVHAESDEHSVRMYSLVYRGTDHVGMTSVLGPEASPETLVDFARAAHEHEEQTLG